MIRPTFSSPIQPGFTAAATPPKKPEAATPAAATGAETASAGDLVSLAGGAIDPGAGQAVLAARNSGSLARSAGHSAAAASASAGGSLPALVARYFSAGEWSALNPGAYHDEHHPVHVAETAGDLARASGRSEERSTFLQQVALLHDADERVNLTTGGRNAPVTPARAPVTLEWMDQNQSVLQGRMGWDKTDFTEAKALIARTDFPFNEAPKNLGTRYDGQSPVTVYQGLLNELPSERRQATMEDGLLLRFADQVGNYTRDNHQSAAYVQGLAAEMKAVGVPVTPEDMAKNTPGFMKTAGLDVADDFKLASQLGVPDGGFASREQLLDKLPDSRRSAFLNLQNNGF